MTPGGQQKLTPAQLNSIARAAIKQRAVAMEQLIYSQSFTSATGVAAAYPVINIIPRNVGLIRGFWVQVIATITATAGMSTTDLTDFGPANLLSQIQFNDLNNNTRIQTSGWHLAMVNAIKARRPFDASLVNGGGVNTYGGGIASGTVANINYPINMGNNFVGAISAATGTQVGQIQAPPTIAAAASGAGTCVIMWYWVPLAYSNDDLRGAVYANVVNATMQLNLTLNPNFLAATATDGTLAGYVSSGATNTGVWSSVTINVYQNYLDQLPVGQGGVLLPILDLATIYELKNTSLTAITPAQDFPIQFANFRDFVSTTAVFVDAAAGTRVAGTDINYWALQSANFTNIWKKTPALIALQTRNHLQADPPPGVYYFGSREKPISTVQYGNMQLVLNASTAAAGAYVLVGYEDFALVQTLSMAGSLAAS